LSPSFKQNTKALIIILATITENIRMIKKVISTLVRVIEKIKVKISTAKSHLKRVFRPIIIIKILKIKYIIIIFYIPSPSWPPGVSSSILIIFI